MRVRGMRKMPDALIGATGFVGGNLARQHVFAAEFNSRTIGSAAGRDFATVVCAAAPGSMFEANKFPERDEARMRELMQQLSRIGAERFVLISSIAVLADFAGQDDERTDAFQAELAYGRNRRAMEVFCAERFDRCLILRLPALFGHGIKKNFLFDLLNPVPSMLTPARYDAALGALPERLAETLRAVFGWNETVGMHTVDRARLAALPARADLEAALTEKRFAAVQFTHPDSTFQFYGLDALWADIGTCFASGIEVLHLAPEPLRAGDVHKAVTDRTMPETGARIHHEDMRSRHAALWGRTGPYLASAGQVQERLKRFFAAEAEARVLAGSADAGA